jgi:hypothetical protein
VKKVTGKKGREKDGVEREGYHDKMGLDDERER